MSEGPKTQKPETLPAEYRAQALANQTDMFFNVAKFEHGWRVATMLSQANMVPDHFKNSPGDVMIAINYADRIKHDIFMVMQCMYVVHGKPGIEGKLVASLINQSGKYKDPLKYEWSIAGNKQASESFDPTCNDDDYGCRAIAIDRRSGKQVKGPKITWFIVREEEWDNDSTSRKGKLIKSKWNTMPEIMFMYRAASWFANVHCPEVKLGMQTTEELKDSDIINLSPTGAGTYAPEESTDDLASRIMGEETGPDETKAVESQQAANESEKRLNKTPEPAVDATQHYDGSEEPEEPTDTAGIWWHTDNWLKLRSTGFSKFMKEYGTRLNEIPDNAVCEYKGKSYRVADAIREKFSDIFSEDYQETDDNSQEAGETPPGDDYKAQNGEISDSGSSGTDDRKAKAEAKIRADLQFDKVSVMQAFKECELPFAIHTLSAEALERVHKKTMEIVDGLAQ